MNKEIASHFEQFKLFFEQEILSQAPFQLLELNYTPYCFGNGHAVYRQKGRNIEILYDGKEFYYLIRMSPLHVKYKGSHDTSKWEVLFEKKTEENLTMSQEEKVRLLSALGLS